MLGRPRKSSDKHLRKEAYDDQRALDELNTILMSTTDLEELLDKTTNFIRTALDLRFCSVIISGRHTSRVSSGDGGSLTTEVIEALQDLRFDKNFPTTLTTVSSLKGREELFNLLHSNKVAVIVKLSNPGNNLTGHMILGAKVNSSQYTNHELLLVKTMADELLLSMQGVIRLEELQGFNLKLQDKVREVTHNLHQTSLKLKTLDQTKDDFISMASHQLRTPLTSVKGYVSMVLDGDAGQISPLQHKLLNQAFISSQRMVYLISDLLNVSRIRTGEFILEPVACNLADVVKGEVDQLVGTAESRGLEISYKKPEHFPILMLDETKLRQVVMNFIDNAIYYTPSGGSITVNLVEKALSIEFTVVDTGMGVPRSEQHRLFSKFFRGDNAKHARPDGTGLGLFMAKKVVIAQGGSIFFKSQEKRGSTFGFSFAKSKLVLAKPNTESHSSDEK